MDERRVRSTLPAPWLALRSPARTVGKPPGLAARRRRLGTAWNTRRPWPPSAPLAPWFAAIAVAVCCVLPAARGELGIAGGAEARYLDALTQRRLDRLLEAYCRRALASSGSSDEQRALFAVQLASLRARQASEEKEADSRDRLWREAARILDTELDRVEREAARLAIRLRRAELAFQRGDWEQRFHELTASAEAGPSRAAITGLGEARTRLAELRRTLQDRVQELEEGSAAERQRAPAVRDFRNAVEDLLALATLRWSEARVGRPFANPSEELPEELAAGLSEAITILEARVGDDPRQAPRQALERLLAAYRLAGRFDAALSVVARARPGPESPDRQSEADLLLAEQVETLLAAGRPLEALAALHGPRSRRETPPARWELLYLRTLLQQAQAMASQPEKSATLQNEALRQFGRINEQHAGIWARRAELEVLRYATTLRTGTPTGLAGVAGLLERAGRRADAATLYQRAAKLAKDDDASLARQLEQAAGLAAEAANLPARARDAFVRAADLPLPADASSGRPQADAPTLLLRAILAARKAYQQGPSSESRTAYEGLLRRHSEDFPQHPTVGQVRYLQAELLQASGAYAAAIDRYAAIPTGHALAEAGVLQTSRCYESWLRPTDHEGGSVADEPWRQAVAFHDPPPTLSSPADQAEVRLRAARFRLDERSAEPGVARDLLEELVADPATPSEWRTRGRRYLLLTLSRLGDYTQAERQANFQAEAGRDEVLASARLLIDVARNATDARQKLVGRLLERLTARLPKADEGEAVREPAWVRVWTAIAIGERDGLTQARQILERLLLESPDDRELREALAYCFARSGKYEAALKEWQRLRSAWPRGSEGWFRAQLQTVVALRRLGRPDQADKLLRWTEVLYPDLGGPELRDRFRAERERLGP